MFTRDGESYLPTDRARGPWDQNYLHGGPVGTLFAHAFETESGETDFLLARMTIDLMQPVPVAPLNVNLNPVRENRRTRYLDAALLANGTTVARASALLLRRSGESPAASTLPARDAFPNWDQLPPGKWGRHSDIALFHNGVEVREIRKPFAGQPMAVWARVPYELLPGRALTPLERVATLSDFGSGIGIMSQSGAERVFINGDITLYLHREPQGEWLCLEGMGRGDHAGIATSSVNLHDALGLFGHVGVAAIVNRLSASPGLRT